MNNFEVDIDEILMNVRKISPEFSGETLQHLEGILNNVEIVTTLSQGMAKIETVVDLLEQTGQWTASMDEAYNGVLTFAKLVVRQLNNIQKENNNEINNI